MAENTPLDSLKQAVAVVTDLLETVHPLLADISDTHLKEHHLAGLVGDIITRSQFLLDIALVPHVPDLKVQFLVDADETVTLDVAGPKNAWEAALTFDDGSPVRQVYGGGKGSPIVHYPRMDDDGSDDLLRKVTAEFSIALA